MVVWIEKMLKILIVIFIIVIILAGTVMLMGIPGERDAILKNAQKYVTDTYGLTPAEVQITTFYLWFPVTVDVKTEENDFWFTLRASRFLFGSKFNDDFLEKKTGYILSREIRTYVDNATNGQGRVWADIITGRTGILNQFSLSELEENPNIAFEKLQGLCRLGIALHYAIPDIDYNLIYDIYSHVFELGINPYSITFSFYEDENREAILRVSFYDNDQRPTRDSKIFADVDSFNDLKSLFEEAIQRKLSEEQ